MNKPTLFLVSFLFGIVSALIVVGVYSINRSIHAPLGNTYVREGDNVCLKQLRVVYLVSTDNARPDNTAPEKPSVPRLCSAPQSTQVRARIFQMKGDTYDVKCSEPGYPASEKPIEIFYWDTGKGNAEFLEVRSTAAPGAFIATPHCERYGIRPIK
jgi:hypothetical protein